MRSVDTLSVILLVAFTTLATLVLSRPTPAQLAVQPRPVVDAAAAERTYLRTTYGAKRHSQNEEEWIIRDVFKDRRDGVFVDVGAGHFKHWSNTYYLEHALGWRGVAIEPQTSFAVDYGTHRPKTTLFSVFAGDQDDATATLHVSPDKRHMASSDQAFAERWAATTPVRVPTLTLNTILARAGIESVDFVSIDVELAEPQVLAGFDLTRYRPALVCIEAHPEVRDSILRYFATREYVVVGKYLRVDDRNLYFVPLSTTLPSFPESVQREWTRHRRH